MLTKGLQMRQNRLIIVPPVEDVVELKGVNNV